MRFLLCLAKLRRNSQAQDSARLCWTLRCLAQAWSTKRVQKLCVFTPAGQKRHRSARAESLSEEALRRTLPDCGKRTISTGKIFFAVQSPAAIVRLLSFSLKGSGFFLLPQCSCWIRRLQFLPEWFGASCVEVFFLRSLSQD